MNSTIFWTILSGILTFIAGQMLLKMIVEPVLEARKTIGLVAHALLNRAAYIANPGLSELESIKAVSSELRQLAAALHAHLYSVPAYPIFSPLFRLPRTEAVLTAVKNLIGLSNSLYDAKSPRVYEINAKRVEAIANSLGLYMHENERCPKDEPASSASGHE